MYEIVLQNSAKKFLEKLDNSSQKEIIKKLEKLETNPQLGKPLTANLAGSWSLRIGKYRAIYTIKDDELVVLVLRLGHRKNIY